MCIRDRYIHGCPNEAVGYHSGTPRGNVDVVPVEADGDVLKNYRALAFMGYNRAQAEDLDKLTDYVEQGGTLILGWAHLNTQTERTAIENYCHAYPAHPFVKRLGGSPDFVAGKMCIRDRPLPAKVFREGRHGGFTQGLMKALCGGKCSRFVQYFRWRG